MSRLLRGRIFLNYNSITLLTPPLRIALRFNPKIQPLHQTTFLRKFHPSNLTMSSIPATQRSIRIHENGGPEVVKLDTDVPVAEISDTQILVKAKYAGVNFIDTYFRSGLYPSTFPSTLGREGAGEVVKVGPKVTKFAVGDRVGYIGQNAYSEYPAFEESALVVKLPEAVEYSTAAASLIQGLTALTFVHEAHEVKKGDYVLIHAAAGGTGSIFVQLAKYYGATVIGTTSSPEKAAIAKANGADYIINYRIESVVDRVKEITQGRGVNAVFDGVGKDTYEISLESVGRKGTLVSFGNASGAVPPVSLLKLSSKNVKLLRPSLFNYLSEPEEWAHYSKLLFKLIDDGNLKISVFKTFPFEETSDAISLLESGKTTGKIIVKI